jgi:thioredoxin reductase (NADPH)
MDVFDVVVIGSGPAGLSAALYAARANLSTRVIAGPQPGGQVSLTWEIDNYLGFPETLSGAELTERMVQHAEKFGAGMVYDEVSAVDLAASPFTVSTYGGAIRARALVVAAGASAKKLGVPGEDPFVGRGVSYCATCDGAFFKGHDVLVVGGGDSALEEALFLTRFASTVRVLHRRDSFRAGVQLQERVAANAKITPVWNTVVDEIRGNGKVAEVAVHRVDTGEAGVLAATGVFIFIGHYPNSALFRSWLAMDGHGYVQVDERQMTSIPGVFACGEIADPVWKQVATSVGQGAQAGMAVQSWLGQLDR